MTMNRKPRKFREFECSDCYGGDITQLYPYWVEGEGPYHGCAGGLHRISYCTGKEVYEYCKHSCLRCGPPVSCEGTCSHEDYLDHNGDLVSTSECGGHCLNRPDRECCMCGSLWIGPRHGRPRPTKTRISCPNNAVGFLRCKLCYELIDACRNGVLSTVKRLLEYSSATDLRDTRSAPIVNIAAKNGREEVVKELVEKGADVTLLDPNGRTALHWAAGNGNSDAIQVLVKAGAPLDLADGEGLTALHIAVHNKASLTVRCLLEAGAGVDIREKSHGETALETTIREGDDGILNLLISYGAAVNLKDRKGWSPLYLAVQRDHLKSVSNLLKAGASTTDRDPILRETVLHRAVSCGNEAMVRLLLDYGASTNVRDYQQRTPLHLAIRHSQKAVVKLLLDSGCDLTEWNLTGTRSWNVLYKAVVEKDIDLVKLLVEAGINVNLPIDSSPRNYTALQLSLGHNLEIMRKLMENGALVTHRDSEGATLLHRPFGGCDRIGVFVSELVSRGIDIDSRTENGETPLHYSAQCGDQPRIHALIANGASIEARASSDKTPLHYAAQSDRLHAINILLDKGADIEARSCSGETALHLAACRGGFVIKILISRGAYIDAKTSAGKTALHLAVENEQFPAIDCLINLRADIKARTSDGKTIETLAAELERPYVTQQLLSNRRYNSGLPRRVRIRNWVNEFFNII